MREIFATSPTFDISHHRTKSKISFMSCLPKHELSDTRLEEDRIEFCKINEMCRKFALSYTFPMCMKSEFISSACSFGVNDCVATYS